MFLKSSILTASCVFSSAKARTPSGSPKEDLLPSGGFQQHQLQVAEPDPMDNFVPRKILKERLARERVISGKTLMNPVESGVGGPPPEDAWVDLGLLKGGHQ